MKYSIHQTARFSRDVKRASKRGKDLRKLNSVINQLAAGTPLPAANKDHALSGNWAGHRECHVEPDWLLIYYTTDETLVLTLARTGTHTDLLE